MRRWNLLLLVFCLILNSISLSVIAPLRSRAEEHCFTLTEPYFFSFSVMAFTYSAFGFVSIVGTFPRVFRLYLAINVVASLGLFGTLIPFWTVVFPTHNGADHWWKTNFLQERKNWDSIVHCFQRKSFCHARNPGLSGCCNQPTDCVTNSSNRDCLQYVQNTSVLCFNCRSCMEETFFRLRSDYKSNNVELSVAILLHLAVVGVQIFLFWWNPLFGTPPAQQLELQPEPAQQHEQQPEPDLEQPEPEPEPDMEQPDQQQRQHEQPADPTHNV